MWVNDIIEKKKKIDWEGEVCIWAPNKQVLNRNYQSDQNAVWKLLYPKEQCWFPGCTSYSYSTTVPVTARCRLPCTTPESLQKRHPLKAWKSPARKSMSPWTDETTVMFNGEHFELLLHGSDDKKKIPHKLHRDTSLYLEGYQRSGMDRVGWTQFEWTLLDSQIALARKMVGWILRTWQTGNSYHWWYVITEAFILYADIIIQWWQNNWTRGYSKIPYCTNWFD